MNDRCKSTIHHISRIQGQLETLKAYITEEQACEKVVQLTSSIVKSCDSLKGKLTEGYIVHELLKNKKLTQTEKNKIENIVKLSKS